MKHDDSLITASLRRLDAAAASDLTDAERDRADALLARIIATDPTEDPVAETARPSRRKRWLVATGLAGAAAVATPAMFLGGTAYGSWTPEPEALTTGAAAEAATTCRAALEVPDRVERIVVAERRGEWTYVLLAGAGAQAACLLPDDVLGQERPAQGGYFGSYDTDAPAPPSLAPDGIEETTSMEGSTDEGWFTWAEGYVGSDVVGVTVRTSSGREIEASVEGGRFAAWWPSAEQSSENESEAWSYTVRLAE